jgi:hypothetical protein
MRWLRRAGAERKVHVGAASYDDWAVVRDFEDLDTALAFRDRVREAGIKAVLTSDWELDRFGHGDIALRVESIDYGEAEVLLSGLDD